MKLNISKKNISTAKEISRVYLIVYYLVEYSKLLNVLELIKYLIYNKSIKKGTDAESRKKCNNFIAFYIVFKWILLFVFISFKLSHMFFIVIVWYMLFINIHTYFLHHFWDLKFKYNIQSFRRRFLNLIQAVCFSNVVFSYFYSIPYKSRFEIISGFDYQWFYSELRFSFANSVSNTNFNFFDINMVSVVGSTITLTQLLLTFVFISILLSTSLNPPIQKEPNNNG